MYFMSRYDIYIDGGRERGSGVTYAHALAPMSVKTMVGPTVLQLMSYFDHSALITCTMSSKANEPTDAILIFFQVLLFVLWCPGTARLCHSRTTQAAIASYNIWFFPFRFERQVQHSVGHCAYQLLTRHHTSLEQNETMPRGVSSRTLERKQGTLQQYCKSPW